MNLGLISTIPAPIARHGGAAPGTPQGTTLLELVFRSSDTAGRAPTSGDRYTQQAAWTASSTGSGVEFMRAGGAAAGFSDQWGGGFQTGLSDTRLDGAVQIGGDGIHIKGLPNSFVLHAAFSRFDYPYSSRVRFCGSNVVELPSTGWGPLSTASPNVRDAVGNGWVPSAFFANEVGVSVTLPLANGELLVLGGPGGGFGVAPFNWLKITT